jgi:hypothetical protein
MEVSPGNSADGLQASTAETLKLRSARTQKFTVALTEPRRAAVDTLHADCREKVLRTVQFFFCTDSSQSRLVVKPLPHLQVTHVLSRKLWPHTLKQESSNSSVAHLCEANAAGADRFAREVALAMLRLRIVELARSIGSLF